MKNTQEAVQRLEELIFSDVIPLPATLTQTDYDNLLNARDASAFATPWTDAYNAISSDYNKVALDQREKARIDKIREYVYKRVYQRTEVSDLASYVSDDFDLILKCLLLDAEHDWVNALWLSYKEGAIPSGALTKVSGSLKDFVMKH